MATVKPLNIIFNAGYQESFEVDPVNITGDAPTDSQSVFFQSMAAGRMATTDANGYIALADGATDFALGFIIVSGSGYPYENLPAAASGRIAVLCGKCKIETDQVVESNIVPGTKLYVGTGTNVGMLTSVASVTGQVVAIARSANSASNKNVQISVI